MRGGVFCRSGVHRALMRGVMFEGPESGTNARSRV